MQRRNPFASCFAGLLVVASIVSSPVLAQGSPIGKGSWIISGNAGANSQHDDTSDQTVTSISLLPSALMFVHQGLAIGGAVSLGYFNTSSGSTKSYGVGPNIRYYFSDPTAKTLPYVSGTFAPSWSSSDPKSSTALSSTNHSIELEGAFGVTHLLATHVGITGEAFYDHFSIGTDAGPLHTNRTMYSIGARFGVTAFLY
jgi:hypothetical protein